MTDLTGRPDQPLDISVLSRSGWRRARLVAAAVLLWERFWPLAVPAVSVALLFAAVSWLGLWQVVPAAARYVLLALFAAGFLYALARLRHLRLPGRDEMVRRVELASRLEDRPITALSDEMAVGADDPFSRALWVEHRRRMAARLRDLAAGTPAPDANRVDPWALRAFVALIAFAAFGFSFGPQGGRVADAFRIAPDIAELRTRLDAWINPPPYTRKPPIFLTGRHADATGGADRLAIEVPQGSDFFLRIVGSDVADLAFVSDGGSESIAATTETGETPDEAAPRPATAAAAQIEFTFPLQRSGTVVLSSGGATVAQWPVTVMPDTPPSISFAELPTAALSGSLQMAYSVEDDYGVTRAEAAIESLEARDADARPLVEAPEMALPLPRQRARSGTAKVNRDLTQHPWAGGSVRITLLAHDDAGQTGRSRPHEMVLPGRRFSNPLALALVEQRRILALDANKALHVANMLDALTIAPEEFTPDTAAFMAMRVAYRRIIDAYSDDQLRDTLDLLWETALAIEFGDMSEAERRLREAQENLSKALEEGASDEEIARLMDELRKAMDEYMQMLAREALENPLARNPLLENEMLRTLRQRDLDRMLDQIENLARSGSRDAARQMLSELQRMMDNLRAGRHMQQQQAEGNQMNQALDKLSELMRRQQELMDETFRMEQNSPENRDGQQQQGQMTPEEFAEAMKRLQEQQGRLQQELGELGRQLEGMGLDPSREFGQAQGEMGEAEGKLGRGRPGDATGNQARALEALRNGVQTMMQQMAGDRGQQGQQNGPGQFGGLDRDRTDPLGRRRDANGLETGEDTRVPGEIEAQRAREIMEAIRKRLSQPASPRIEKDYLERLLEAE